MSIAIQGLVLSWSARGNVFLDEKFLVINVYPFPLVALDTSFPVFDLSTRDEEDAHSVVTAISWGDRRNAR